MQTSVVDFHQSLFGHSQKSLTSTLMLRLLSPPLPHLPIDPPLPRLHCRISSPLKALPMSKAHCPAETTSAPCLLQIQNLLFLLRTRSSSSTTHVSLWILIHQRLLICLRLPVRMSLLLYPSILIILSRYVASVSVTTTPDHESAAVAIRAILLQFSITETDDVSKVLQLASSTNTVVTPPRTRTTIMPDQPTKVYRSRLPDKLVGSNFCKKSLVATLQVFICFLSVLLSINSNIHTI